MFILQLLSSWFLLSIECAMENRSQVHRCINRRRRAWLVDELSLMKSSFDTAEWMAVWLRFSKTNPYNDMTRYISLQAVSSCSFLILCHVYKVFKIETSPTDSLRRFNVACMIYYQVLFLCGFLAMLDWLDKLVSRFCCKAALLLLLWLSNFFCLSSRRKLVRRK